MRLYTCCPHQGCLAYRDAMSFLERWGIEPEIGIDNDGHSFKFSVPGSWPSGRKRSFFAQSDFGTGSWQSRAEDAH